MIILNVKLSDLNHHYMSKNPIESRLTHMNTNHGSGYITISPFKIILKFKTGSLPGCYVIDETTNGFCDVTLMPELEPGEIHEDVINVYDQKIALEVSYY